MISPIGNVIERKSPSKSSNTQRINLVSNTSGFPLAEHRSKASAFKSARQNNLDNVDKGESSPGRRDASFILTGGSRGNKNRDSVRDLMEGISRSNDELLEGMTEEQMKSEQQDVLEHFGPDIEELVRKVKQARERRSAKNTGGSNSSTPTPLKDETASKSPGRVRKIRFLDPTEADIHVYESQPSSPKRSVALLPPPPLSDLAGANSDIKLLGTFVTRPKGANEQRVRNSLGTSFSPEPKEGISVNRSIPYEAPSEDNPILARTIDNPTSHDRVTPETTSLPETRYSLSGARLLPSEVRDIPTHLGHHHHSSKSLISDISAGYTFEDLLLLSRSSVSAQRASSLGILAKILKAACEERFYGVTSLNSLSLDDFDSMRRNILDATINALSEKGGVGLRAIDTFWEAIVGVTLAELQITSVEQLPRVEFLPISGNTSLRGPSALSPHTFRMLSLQSLVFLTSLPLKNILPALQTHLLESSPLSLVYSHVLDILFLLAHFHDHARTIAKVSSNGGILFAMLTPHLRSPSNSDSNSGKSAGMCKSILVLQQLALNGRDVAAALLGPADIILRFIVAPLPHFQGSGVLQQDFLASVILLKETITFFSFLARYGLYAHIATTAQAELGTIAEWLLAMVHENCSSEIIIFATRYLEFLEALIVCAHDPHKTTPAHEILWSQVQGWRWMNWIFDLAEAVSTSPYSRTESVIPFIQNFWASLFHCLAAWLAGASSNGFKGGEEEKVNMAERCRVLFSMNNGASLALKMALNTIGTLSIDVITSEVLSTLSENAYLLLGILRLCLPYLNSQIPHPLDLAVHQIHLHCAHLLEGNVIRHVLHFLRTPDLKEDALVSLRPISSLLAVNIQFILKKLVDTETRRKWVLNAVRILSSLLPGDECLARSLVQDFCELTDTELIQVLGTDLQLKDTEWPAGGLHILLPFYLASLSPDTGNANPQSLLAPFRFVGSLFPSSDTLSNSSTLLMPSLSSWYHKWYAYEPDFVLPLRNDWLTWPINHLLRSGSSQVFRNIPSSWDASETDVVKLSLLLVRAVQVLEYQDGEQLFKVSISKSEAIFACMKVFMLEHGQQQIDSGMEVFRDPNVGHSMEALLAHYHAPAATKSDSLEDVSRTFLGNQTSFYQFYTDFVALYDAISFSDPLFGRLLIPPISMSYQLDYRGLLFGDFNHVLRTIKTTPEEIYTDDVREYLWPIEHDATMIGWYFKTIISPSVQGFFRWMSIHHFASNIWPDLEGEGLTLGEAKKLLKALVTRGNRRDIKDVVLYSQSRDSVLLPPKCYEEEKQEIRETRLQHVRTMEDPHLVERLREMLIE